MENEKKLQNESPVKPSSQDNLRKVPFSSVVRELARVTVTRVNPDTDLRQTCTHPFIPDAEGRSTYQNEAGDLSLTFNTEEMDSIGITQPFHKFSYFLGEKSLQATSAAPILTIKTREYVERLGVTPTKEHLKYYRAQIDQFLLLYSSLIVRYQKPDGTRVTTHTVQRYEEGRGFFRVEMDKEYLQDLNNGVLALWPVQYWRVNTRTNPNLLAGLQGVWSQYGNSAAYKRRAEAGEEHIVRRKVASLLLEIPGLPTIQGMKDAGDYRFRQRIIEPFEKIFDTLADEEHVFTEWGYCHDGGKECTRKELENMDIYQFEKLSVYFIIAPDYRITADQIPALIKKNPRKKGPSKKAQD